MRGVNQSIVYSYGEIQPDVETTYFPRPSPEADLSLLPEGRWGMLPHEGAESLFWHATSPSNSLILTWQNAAYDRDANCPTNLQIELFSNGTYVYRYDDHTEHHAVIYPFDLDGDGLENSVDPEPLVAGPDAHGTNPEWYNVVCSNVYAAVESESGIELSPRTGDVNTNAYYFVDVVAERGPAPIRFVADGASRLGNPVLIAQAGETNRVPLLIGAAYSVSSDVPFAVLAPPAVGMAAPFGDPREQRVQWPVPISFTTDAGGAILPNVPEELRPRLGGTFSWTGGCCMSISGEELVYACRRCGCGGCSAVAAFRYEGYSLFQPAVTCGCSHTGGDPVETPFVTTPDGTATLAAGFDRRHVVISDGGSNGVARSTRTVLTLATWGGPNGGTLRVEPANFDRLRAVDGVLPSPGIHSIAPNGTYSVVVTNEGAAASENLDDVRLRATFEEAGTGLRLVRNIRLTVCALSVTGIKFNHDVYGCETDAAGLRRDGTPDGAYRLDDGEWCGRGATNYPACYVGGARPQVWARFAVKPVDVGSVRLGAEAAAAGFPLGGMPTHAVSFSGGDSGWVVLPACDGTNEVPRRVDVAESKWRWHVDGVGDCPLDAPFAFAETGPHRIYTTLAPPQHPWRRTSNDPQCAWAIALDRACTWAKGATSTNEMLAAVTSNIFYNCGLKYDIKEGKSACLTKSASFGLTTYLSGCSGNTVNCFDQAYAVYLFGNLLGADVYVKRLEPFGYLKRTCLVGRGYSNNPFYGDSATYESQPCCDANAVRRSSFSKHFFAMSNGLVFDGCAGPVLGTIGLDAYIQMSVDSSRSPVGSRPGTVADVFDYTDVRRFK